MKKCILFALCAIISMGVYAQAGKKAIGLYASYGTEIKNIGIGAKGQYNFTDAFRGEASFDYFLKKDHISMWDVNLNVHYLFPVGDSFRVYPLAGLSYTRWKIDIVESASTGKFGANLGGGIELDLSSHLVLNAEAKYQLISDFDQAVFSVGFAYKF